MSYTLQALISDRTIIEKAKSKGLHSVALSQRFAMVPITFEMENMPFLPLADEGDKSVTGALRNLCIELSIESRLAYVEAEFFGGEGTQAAWLIENENEFKEAFVHESAINEALKWLGVSADSGRDEFDALGLGKHRDTADWIKQEAYQDSAHNSGGCAPSA